MFDIDPAQVLNNVCRYIKKYHTLVVFSELKNNDQDDNLESIKFWQSGSYKWSCNYIA